MRDTRDSRGECIITRDINAKPMRWGNRMDDERGNLWLEWIDELDMMVLNEGDKPTFERDNSTSIIDVTFASIRVGRMVRDWKVLEEESLSDHNYIYFEVRNQVGCGSELTKFYYNEEMFKKLLNLKVEFRNNERINWVESKNIILETYKETRRQEQGNIRKKPYWWNIEIEREIEECKRIRRNLSRSNRSGRIDE